MKRGIRSNLLLLSPLDYLVVFNAGIKIELMGRGKKRREANSTLLLHHRHHHPRRIQLQQAASPWRDDGSEQRGPADGGGERKRGWTRSKGEEGCRSPNEITST